MRKNIEQVIKLAELGETNLKDMLREDLYQIKNVFRHETDKNNMRRDLLNDLIMKYNKRINSFKTEYGVEFPKLQEEYNYVLSDIKKANIGVKVN